MGFRPASQLAGRCACHFFPDFQATISRTRMHSSKFCASSEHIHEDPIMPADARGALGTLIAEILLALGNLRFYKLCLGAARLNTFYNPE